MAATNNSIASGLQPCHQLRIHVRAAESGFGIRTVLQLHFVRSHQLRFWKIQLRRAHIQRLRQTTVSLDDSALTVALQGSLTQILQHMTISADPDQTLLHFRTTAARTVHHHVKHAGHCGTRLSRMTECLTCVLTELALLSADLSTAMLHDVLGNTGGLVASTLAEMPTGKGLAAYPVAEHLLAIAGNALHDPVPTLAHPIGRNGARRAGTEVAGMVANVPTRTRLVAGLVAHRRRCSTRNGRLDDLLPAGTGDWLCYHMAARYARAGVARKIAGVLPAVEELAAHTVADMERPV